MRSELHAIGLCGCRLAILTVGGGVYDERTDGNRSLRDREHWPTTQSPTFSEKLCLELFVPLACLAEKSLEFRLVAKIL
jgi:hypothetical protein